ncbi:MAG: VTT domain-containing protein [Bdellovibrionota bacterium]
MTTSSQASFLHKNAKLIALQVALAFGVWYAVFVGRQIFNAHPHASLAGLFVGSFLSHATIVFPAPAFALALGFGSHVSPILVGLVCGTSAALGESLAYGLGRMGRPLTSTMIQPLQQWMKKHDLLTLYILSALPNPLFDVAGYAAGTLQISWIRFFLATSLGKGTRFYLLALIGQTWG